jgi:hypothetical protein
MNFKYTQGGKRVPGLVRLREFSSPDATSRIGNKGAVEKKVHSGMKTFFWSRPFLNLPAPFRRYNVKRHGMSFSGGLASNPRQEASHGSDVSGL